VALVAERGEAMQFAAEVQPGTMKSIVGLDDDCAGVACYRADGQVWVANYNAPADVVIAGDSPSVDAAVDQALALGAKKVFPVPVGGAFHTPFMAPARDRLRKALQAVDFRAPDVPVVANVDARTHTGSEDWRRLLSAQLCSPVRWRQSVLRLDTLALAGEDDTGRRADHPALFVELGCGGLLTSLVHRILPSAHAISVATPRDLETLAHAMSGQAVPPLRHQLGPSHHGEHFEVSERMVISPCAGVFEPASTGAAPSGGPGSALEVGTVVGSVSGHEVRSLFAGRLVALLALPGERIRPGQPVAWLRAG
jgi:[acyl-carrier-protein] S-malonyltransferase